MTHSRRDVLGAMGLGAATLATMGPGAASAHDLEPPQESARLGSSPRADELGETAADRADYVIVGGGVAGCVVAARLSEDPGKRVLLLEAGGDANREDVYHLAGLGTLWGEANWHYTSTPQAELGGRVIDQPRGRIVGGSGAIHAGCWSRGIPADYDAWEAMGATGWGWDAARRHFLAIESSRRPDGGDRGRAGPMVLADTPLVSPLTHRFRDACRALGIGETADHNGAQLEGWDLWETFFPGGRRRNTAEAYLTTAVRARPNLAIVTGAMATRILFEGSRARGVEYKRDGQVHRAMADAEVLLCAGAYNTPQLLMLSGIGPAAHLRAMGVAVVHDLPAVGENLVDHVRVTLGGRTRGGDIEPSYPDLADPAQLATWRATGGGPFADNPFTALAFIKTRPTEAYADIELLLHINPPAEMQDDKEASGFNVGVALETVYSRGTVRLASPEPSVQPAIDLRYFSDTRDMEAVARGARTTMALIDHPALSPYAQEKNYDPRMDDAALTALIRETASSTYHPVGTARMGRVDDPNAAVDPQLRVRGLQGLRILDASVMPDNIRGHTVAPTIYIAERGCELIRA